MTTVHHTAIATGAAANADTINVPLSQLDTKLGTAKTPGRVIFADASGNLADDAGLTYNSGTDTLTTVNAVATALTTVNAVATVFTGSHFTSGAVTIADDAATSFTPTLTGTSGILIVFKHFISSATCTSTSLIAAFRASTVGYIGGIVTGADYTLTAGTALTGTTGSDGKINVSSHTDGKIYIENRLGTSGVFYYLVIG